MTDTTDELRRLYLAAPRPDKTMLTSAELRRREELRDFMHRHVDDILAMADEIERLREIVHAIDPALTSIIAGLEDEGDRVYFGSTNDADDLRELQAKVERAEWDRLIAESRELDDEIATLAGGDDGTD